MSLRVLITAFEPYDCWPENASWLALVALTKDLPGEPDVTTRRYPVDFAAVRRQLAQDLAANYDVALHLGQSPGLARIHLEAVGLNVGGEAETSPAAMRPLEEEGPVAYRTGLPLAEWAETLRGAGIPAALSHHAGTYLCNATLYWSCHLSQQMQLKTRAAFVHLPLDTSQVIGRRKDTPSLSAATSAQAVRMILRSLATREYEIA